MDHTPTDKFNSFVQTAQLHREDNDCAVKAVAIACNVSYAEALRALTAAGRKPRSPTRTTTIMHAVQALGCVGKELHKSQLLKTLAAHDWIVKSVTVRQLTMFDWFLPTGSYLVFVNGHVLAYVEGEVHDWMINRKAHVYSMVQITGQLA